jgi:hypothetical protein
VRLRWALRVSILPGVIGRGEIVHRSDQVVGSSI